MRNSAALAVPRRWISLGRLRLFAVGALAGLGQAPFDLPVVALPAFAAAIVLALGDGCPPRDAARRGWWAGFGYFLLTLHWIVDPFFVDPARDGWMAPFALLALPGGLALFWAGAFGAAAWLAPGAGPGRRGLALALTFTLAEMLRAVLFTGFPWAMPATIWVETPLRLLASWIGPHGLNLLTLLAAAGLAGAWAGRGRARLLPLAAALALVGAGGLIGRALLDAVPASPPAGAPVIRLVQPDAPQELKWRPDMIGVFWQRQLDLSAAPVTGSSAARPAAVIWPEVALPYVLGDRPELDRLIVDLAQAPVLVGAQRFAGPRLLNSLVVLDREGDTAALYDKHHLVPFGEFVPGGALAAELGLEGLATDALGGFSAGPGPAVLDLSRLGLGRVLPLICYEAIFPRNAVVPGPRPDWIVQITNDSWFGSFAGPQQHLAQARMRAVEQGLPLARVAQTGISAMIDPAGRITGQIPLHTAGALDAALPAPLPPTPYARWMDAPLHALLALALLVLLIDRRRRAG